MMWKTYGVELTHMDGASKHGDHGIDGKDSLLVEKISFSI